MIVFLSIVFFLLILYARKLQKLYLAYAHLEELNMKRAAEKDRIEKLIREKPDNVIFLSEMIASGDSFRYIGKFESLDKVKAQDCDFANIDERRTFLFKGGKWYEVIDNVSRFKNIMYYDGLIK